MAVLSSVLLAAFIFFLLCRFSSVCLAAGTSGAVPPGLPLPVLTVDAETLEVLEANNAALQIAEGAMLAGKGLPSLFADGDPLAAFVKASGVRRLSGAADGAFEMPADDVLQAVWSPVPGKGVPVRVTLFHFSRSASGRVTFLVAVDRWASMAMQCMQGCFNSFPETLLLKDAQGRILLGSETFAGIARKSVPELIGTTIPELDLPPPFDSLLWEHDQAAVDMKMFVAAEKDAVDADGVRTTYEYKCYPLVAQDGNVRGMCGVCRDITEHSTASDTLRRQGALLQAANDAALLLFSDDEELEDLAWRVLAVLGSVTGADSVEVWRNHGSSEEGLLGTRVFNWADERYGAEFSVCGNTVAYDVHLPGWEAELAADTCIDTRSRELFAPVQEHLSVCGLEAALVAPVIFRSTFWGFIRLGSKVQNHSWGRSEESILRSIGLLLAATMERRLIQNALTESEQRFRDVTMAAGEIVWELDAHGYFSYVSERILDLTGYDPGEVLGKRWEDFNWDEEQGDITGSLFEAGLVSGTFQGIEHRIRAKDGHPIWFQTSGKLLIGMDGLDGLRGTSLDVTGDKQNAESLTATLKALEDANSELEIAAQRAFELARRAESASKAKSEFLANMSHEIRTPLNAVIGMAYLVMKTSLTAKQADYVNKIHTAGVTLLGVVNDILDFSKIESGKMEVESRPFSLVDLLDNLLSIIGSKVEAKGLAAVVHLKPDVPDLLIGDALRLSQVLINLAGNAVKFTEQGGFSVVCSIEKIEGTHVELRFVVQDTGIGIASDQQQRLFQSFSQLDSSITRKYGGTGLGLVISKNIVDIAGGSIELESEPGRGTTVTVVAHFTLDNNAGEDSARRTDLQGAHVLLVEPDALHREQLREVLAETGCRLTVVEDLGLGFAAVSGNDGFNAPPSALILPLHLAEKNNGEALRHLFGGMGLFRVPKVICLAPFGQGDTGSLDPELADRVAVVVERPVLSTKLCNALDAALNGTECRIGGTSAVTETEVPYLPQRRVLLVEDNPVNQQIAVELLRQTGVSVVVADNGRIAVDMLDGDAEAPFDIVFMDLQMPEMDGFSAVAHIRAQARFANLPIIAMTAHATVEERSRCLEAGMDEHLSKPIHVDMLYKTLQQWLASDSSGDAANSGPQLSARADRQKLLDNLSRLNILLDDDDAASCRLFEELRPYLEEVDGTAVATAARAIAEFDFSEALVVLVPMERGIKAALEDN